MPGCKRGEAFESPMYRKPALWSSVPLPAKMPTMTPLKAAANRIVQYRLSISASPSQQVVPSLITTTPGARPLQVGMFDGSPMLWAEQDVDSKERVHVELKLVRTGADVPDAHQYLGSALQVGAAAWHLYVPTANLREGRLVGTQAPAG